MTATIATMAAMTEESDLLIWELRYRRHGGIFQCWLLVQRAEFSEELTVVGGDAHGRRLAAMPIDDAVEHLQQDYGQAVTVCSYDYADLCRRGMTLPVDLALVA